MGDYTGHPSLPPRLQQAPAGGMCCGQLSERWGSLCIIVPPVCAAPRGWESDQWGWAKASRVHGPFKWRALSSHQFRKGLGSNSVTACLLTHLSSTVTLSSSRSKMDGAMRL